MMPTLDPAYQRILAALRKRSGREIRSPNLQELEFLRLTANHGEFREKLRRLGQDKAADWLTGNAIYIGLRWLFLGKKHLEDARSALEEERARALYSRSYYAAYNASKGVRYIIFGFVSLKGDDHGRASELPDDFPNVGKWSVDIPRLLEHRVLADYENWQATPGKVSLSLEDAFAMAEAFVSDATTYLRTKLGVSI